MKLAVAHLSVTSAPLRAHGYHRKSTALSQLNLRTLAMAALSTR